MTESSTIIGMIRAGGVYYHITGTTAEEVFADAVSRISLPDDVDQEALLTGLMERERLMSTSIGYGVALPHPRLPLVSAMASERIYVCYLDRGVHFDAMDGMPVHVLFLILSSGKESHLGILSGLSYLLQQQSFRDTLRAKPDTEELTGIIENHLQGENKQ